VKITRIGRARADGQTSTGAARPASKEKPRQKSVTWPSADPRGQAAKVKTRILGGQFIIGTQTKAIHETEVRPGAL
jgi:hypothetical protein